MKEPTDRHLTCAVLAVSKETGQAPEAINSRRFFGRWYVVQLLRDHFMDCDVRELVLLAKYTKASIHAVLGGFNTPTDYKERYSRIRENYIELIKKELNEDVVLASIDRIELELKNKPRRRNYGLDGLHTKKMQTSAFSSPKKASTLKYRDREQDFLVKGILKEEERTEVPVIKAPTHGYSRTLFANRDSKNSDKRKLYEMLAEAAANTAKLSAQK